MKMKGWYFSKKNCRLRYGDRRQIATGITHMVDVEPVLCKAGLHASRRLLDALDYAPGPFVWRVELSGQIVHDADKSVATERTYLWGFDATEVLRDFARRCALDVIHEWDAPEIVVRFLATGDMSIRDAAVDAGWNAGADAAWDAAWDTARAAARDAANYAARDAVFDEAWAAAGVAAWTAARAAARAAARVTVLGAARNKQNRRLTAMVAAHRPR